LCWGSNFPGAECHCTYRQSLEVIRTHCDFLSQEERVKVLGGTLASLLARRPRSSLPSRHF
jgi:hypothetical protein